MSNLAAASSAWLDIGLKSSQLLSDPVCLSDALDLSVLSGNSFFVALLSVFSLCLSDSSSLSPGVHLVLVSCFDNAFIVHVGCASQGLGHLESKNLETSLLFENVQDLEVVTVVFGFGFVGKISEFWIYLFESLIKLSCEYNTHEGKEAVLCEPDRNRHSHENWVSNKAVLDFIKHWVAQDWYSLLTVGRLVLHEGHLNTIWVDWIEFTAWIIDSHFNNWRDLHESKQSNGSHGDEWNDVNENVVSCGCQFQNIISHSHEVKQLPETHNKQNGLKRNVNHCMRFELTHHLWNPQKDKYEELTEVKPVEQV